jgi:hypothetical protein
MVILPRAEQLAVLPEAAYDYTWESAIQRRFRRRQETRDKKVFGDEVKDFCHDRRRAILACSAARWHPQVAAA